ncbi:LCP family protein [Actinopolymorpha sp. B11F2]|uniref:LCP family glycopolymer transferase n=1 Tax=Actinopolymorpha sp. B11F2 TaxID=3160862 RepID=UPI0032E38EBE
MSVPLAVAVTVLGTIIPGTGLIVAGRRKLGLTVVGIFGVLSLAAGTLALSGQRTLLHWSVEPRALLLIGLVVPTLGAAWCLLVIVTYRSLSPTARTRRRSSTIIGNLVAGTLALAVLAPFVVAGRYALIQKSVIEQVFSVQEAASGLAPTSTATHASRPAPTGPAPTGPAPTGPAPTSPAAQGPASTSPAPTKALPSQPAPTQAIPTQPAPTQAAPTQPASASPAGVVQDPWGGRDRINVLLLGGDAGPDRTGTRTDTIILASIDTHTGDTVLFSVPRNLQKVPFPTGSALAQAYPNGFQAPGDVEEQLLTEVYESVPEAHPGLVKAADPGAVAVKQAVSGALAIPVDYYVLVNLKGFERLIDALGGLTLNVNERVAIGGEADAGLKPHSYIEEGPNQRMDGWKALWFARGRYGASDWDRMLRQRCVIKAIIDQANPVTLLTRYEAVAKTSKDIVQSDIPASTLPAFVDLGLKVKQANVTNVAFLRDVIKPSNPDFAHMRSTVRQALHTSGDKQVSPPDHLDNLTQACAYDEG